MGSCLSVSMQKKPDNTSEIAIVQKTQKFAMKRYGGKTCWNSLKISISLTSLLDAMFAPGDVHIDHTLKDERNSVERLSLAGVP